MSSFSGRLRQLIDPSIHNDNHISLIDSVGQEFCIECSVSDISSESSAVLHKTHVCHCLDQVVGAGVEIDRLCNILFPSIVECISDLGDMDSPPISKLNNSLITLAESIQVHLSSSEVHSFISILVDTITANGVSKQPHLISLLGRTSRAAQRQGESNMLIYTLCTKYGSFMERLIRSSLVSMIPELLCDVLFIFSLAASEPIVQLTSSSSFDSVSSMSQVDSQQQFNKRTNNNVYNKKNQHRNQNQDELLELSLSCRGIFQTTYQVADVLVGSMEKLGHEGCWTNFLALLSHFSNAVEEGVLDDQGFFDILIYGQQVNTGKNSSISNIVNNESSTQNKSDRNKKSSLMVRLGVCARAQLVQTSCPASLCAAARVFSSLSRLSSGYARQLLRDGVGEFAIAGLNTQGLASGPSIKEALSHLLDDLSREEPIAFFHPSHFHPFALEALLEVLGLKEGTNDTSDTSYHGQSNVRDTHYQSSNKWNQYTSEHGADSLMFTGPLASVLLRCSQHSSIIDNVGIGVAIDSICRAGLANLNAGLNSVQSLSCCLVGLTGLLKIKGEGHNNNHSMTTTNGSSGEGLLTLLISSLFCSDMIMHEFITVSSLELASLWLQSQSHVHTTKSSIGMNEEEEEQIGASWIAEVILGQQSQFRWIQRNENRGSGSSEYGLSFFPMFAALIADLVMDSQISLKDKEAFSLAQYICDEGFLTSSLSTLVALQHKDLDIDTRLNASTTNEGGASSSTNDLEAMVFKGFGATAGRLVGFKFPITDGLVALTEELANQMGNQAHNEVVGSNSFENILLEVILNGAIPPTQRNQHQHRSSISERGLQMNTMEEGDYFDDTFEAFEVALLILSHSPISSFLQNETAHVIKEFLDHRFSTQYNQYQKGLSYSQSLDQNIDWAGLRGGIHALHLTAQLDSVQASSLILGTTTITPTGDRCHQCNGFIDKLASCIGNGNRGEPLITAISLGMSCISLIELDSSPQVNSIIFQVSLSGFKRYCQQFETTDVSNTVSGFNGDIRNTSLTISEKCDNILENLNYIENDNVSKFILKVDLYRYRLRLIDGVISHLTSNYRNISLEQIGDAIILLEVLIVQEALINSDSSNSNNEYNGNTNNHDTMIDVGPLSSVHKVSALHEFVAFSLRDIPQAAPITVRLFSKLLIHATASLLTKAQVAAISVYHAMPPPMPTSNRNHMRLNEPTIEDMLPVFGRCTPMLALAGETKQSPQETSSKPLSSSGLFSTSAQVSSIAALTWVTLAAIQTQAMNDCDKDHDKTNSLNFVNTLYRSHGKQIAALVFTSAPKQSAFEVTEANSEVRASAAAFTLALTSGLSGTNYTLQTLPPPLLSSAELLNIVDPLIAAHSDDDVIMDEGNSCNNALIALCLNIISRYIYTNAAVQATIINNENHDMNMFIDFENFHSSISDTLSPLPSDKNLQNGTNASKNNQVWWEIGPRKMTRLVNAAYHHSLSGVQVIQDAAIALLIVFSELHSEVCDSSLWHSVVTQEILSNIITSNTISSNMEDHDNNIGSFDLLFLSTTLQHQSPSQAFSPIINKTTEEILSIICGGKSARDSNINPMMLKHFMSSLHNSNLFKDEAHFQPQLESTPDHSMSSYYSVSNSKNWISLGLHLQLPSNFDWASGLWANKQSSRAENNSDKDKHKKRRGLFHPNQFI